MPVVCPLCDYRLAELLRTGDSGLSNFYFLDCQGCGTVLLDQFLLAQVAPPTLVDGLRATRHLIAGLAREGRLRGHPPLRLTKTPWQTLAAGAPDAFHERVDRLLANLRYQSSSPGSWTSLYIDRDRPLAFAESHDALTYAFESLRAQGLVDYKYATNGPNEGAFRLTYAGRKRIAELEDEGIDSAFGFIAMTRRIAGDSPDARMEDVLRKGLEAGVRAAGFEPLFMEDVQHTDRIDDRILVDIKRSRFIVADMTGFNANVSFEAGYAIGLRKPVFWTCEGTAQKHPFDFRQYKRLDWAFGNESKLATDLQHAIENVVGRGPHEVVPPPSSGRS